MMKLKGDYFDGAWHQGTASETYTKFSPVDLSQKLWECSVDHSHISSVIESALRGFQTWRKLSFNERAKYLQKYRDIVSKREEEIAQALALEVGKPLWEAKTEAAALKAKVDVTLEDSLSRIADQSFPGIMPGLTGHTFTRPLGPSLVIGPFNFPCHLANGQILSALLAGNSIIFKPSEKTIYSSQLMMECLEQAGFPKGVVNFINGGAHTSTELTKSPLIKGIFFTGSVQVGKKILEQTHQDLSKLVALELGGRNATIIHEDANKEHALAELLMSCYLTSGQRCTSTSLIFVHQNILGEIQDKFKNLVQKIIVDHPIDFKTKPFMSSLIDQHAEDLYFDFHKMALDHGAQTLVAPEKLELTHQGHYVSPSLHLLEDPKLDSEFFQREIFGPQACLIPYTDIEQAIDMANATPFGLAGSIFTQTPALYDLCRRDLQTGLVNLNRSTVGASSKLPFGGVKNSGNYHPAAVSMIDHCVATIASLETYEGGSSISTIPGLKDA